MSYLRKKYTYNLILIICLFVLVCLVGISGTLGSADISFADTFRIIFSKIPLLKDLVNTEDIKASSILIITKIRLPRIVLSILIGMCLSVVGTTLQGLFRNPMADTGVLGISYGAGLGAAIAIVLGMTEYIWGIGLSAVFAFVGALTTIVIVYNIAKTNGRVPVITLLLAGIAISFIASSMTQLIMVLNRDKVEMIVMWTMGSLSAASWKKVIAIGPIIFLSTISIIFFARELNMISIGEDTASSLGINVEKTKKLLLIICSIATAACVSVSGVIGFVGIAVPHIIRLMVGADHRVLLPYSAVGGALFMLVCDTMARTLASPADIPVGIITSLFGAPFFVYLLVKKKLKATSNG